MILLVVLFLFIQTTKPSLILLPKKDLSCHQARWMETLSIYNCKFVYIKGEDNTMADALL